ncbi:hypothetical protein F5X97DRAFT_337379 [Nemania serpens]|nr:hypothetical protein F5X97DRAFT_337379 [Nemania serpens]
MITKPQHDNFRPTVSKCGLQILREALGLSKSTAPSPWSNSLLVSIDFEMTDNIMSRFTKGEECQVGLAKLDTRDLQRASLPPYRRLVKTDNYVSGSYQYVTKASKEFLFGKPSFVTPAKILKTIQAAIPQNQDRRIVMVSHGAWNEILMLGALGYKFARNIYFVDTFHVAQEAFGYCEYSLGDLLRRVECPHGGLHNGGNDANFTLRACLLLALHNYEEDEDTVTLARYLSEIATSDIPHRVDPEVRAAQRKEKRLAKSRKHQARSWSIEQQDQIRAERAAKKAALERNAFY